MSPHSLYIHIPFCTKKCPYCHFYVIPDKKEHRTLLLDSLLLEWKSIKKKLDGHPIVSIYFGGGTPALFGPQAIGKLLNQIHADALVVPDCEITLEANPESLTKEMAGAYRSEGVNRLSIGVQSLVDSSLITLGRTHSSSHAIQAIQDASDAGITNISIDLMLELPNQVGDELTTTLSLLPSLPITHLSLYNLTIEPHTSFYKNRDSLALPTEDEGKAMLDLATQEIEKAGLTRYEISAFAKPGYTSRHNTGYWEGRPFYGLGPSAFSYIDGARFQNIPHLNRYARALKEGSSPIDFEETLPYPKNVCELLAVRLRLLEGAPLPHYNLPEETHASLSRLEAEGFLHIETDCARLTEKGRLFYDTVASELMPDA